MATGTPSKEPRNTRRAAPQLSATPQSHIPQDLYHSNFPTSSQNTQGEMEYPVQPTTPPRTPRRDNSSIPQNKSNSAIAESGSKQKARNKNRPKNVNVSPAVTRNDRRTPPLSSASIPSSTKPMATPSTTAYAGPTFHASPAPSALPIPSFYSKSVPDSPGLKGIKQIRDVSLSNNSEPSTTSATPALVQPNEFEREESPLDIFFRADREEKARARSASATQNPVTAMGPFQPPLSPRSSQTPPAPMSQSRRRYGPANRSSTSGMFAFELDGPNTPGSPYGPAFSTPYSERINAARAGNNSTQAQASPLTQGPLDRSEQIKAYLFSGPPSQPSTTEKVQPAPGHSRPQFQNYFVGDSKAHPTGPRANARSSGLRQEVTPTKTPTKTPEQRTPYNISPTPSRVYRSSATPSYGSSQSTDMPPTVPSDSPNIGASSGGRSAELKGMEDSLRKILKLDSAGSSGVNVSNMNNVKEADISVPNYGGGRPPSMKGMHNGVTGTG